MITPNVWGQGQIFAYSALDGATSAKDDFVGLLCGDKIGIRFYSKIIRELSVVNVAGLKPEFKTVASDLIEIDTVNGKMNILYADTHTVVGNIVAPASVVVLTEGTFECKRIDDIEVQCTNDGEYTALLRRGDRFSFAYAHSLDEVMKKVNNGIRFDIEKSVTKKRKIFKEHSLRNGHPYAALYAKFLSVMKSQIYSSEGKFKSFGPHRIGSLTGIYGFGTRCFMRSDTEIFIPIWQKI